MERTKSIITMLVLILAVLYNIMYRLKNSLLWFPMRLKTPLKVYPGVSYERVKCLGDTELAVYYLEKPNMRLPFVLYCHGTMGIQEFETDWIYEVRTRANVVGFDYRGYGRSDGEPSEYAAEYDLLYLLLWMKRKFPTISIRDDVILWGRSIGTYIVMKFVGNPERQAFLPNRLFLYTPFVRFSDVFRNVGFGMSFLAHLVGNMDVTAFLQRYCEYDKNRRVIMIGTQHDSLTPWESCIELCKTVNSDQIILREFDGVHSSSFKSWDLFFELENIYQNIIEDEKYEAIQNLFLDVD